MSFPEEPTSSGPSFQPPSPAEPVPGPYPTPAPAASPGPAVASTSWQLPPAGWQQPTTAAGQVQKPSVGFAIIAWFQLFLGGVTALVLLSIFMTLEPSPYSDDPAYQFGRTFSSVIFLTVLSALPITTGICTLVLRGRLMTAWRNQKPF